MAITTMAQVLDALPGQRVAFSKSAAGAASAGGFGSTWLGTGQPAAGVAPSSGLAGDVPTSATTGALQITNAASGALALARFQAGYTASLNGTIMLYDRLWHNSGISATAVTAQTIGSVALTRPDALGKQVEAWWQVYVVMGAGTPQITLTYTDQDGNTGNSALSGVLATTLAANRTGPFQLAAGDTGVRSIQTYQADATFTSGTLGLVLRRKLLDAPVPFTGIDTLSDALRTTLVEIPANACLEVLVGFGSLSGTANIFGELSVIEG